MSKFCQNCGMVANDGDKFCPKLYCIDLLFTVRG